MYDKTTFLNSQQARTLIMFIIASGITLLTGILAANYTILVLGAVLLVLIGLAVLTKPDFITLAVIFIIYTNAAVIAVKFHGVPYIFGAFIPMLLAIPFVYQLVFRHQKPIFSQNLMLLLGLLIVQLLGTIFAQSIDTAVENVLTFIAEGIVIYFLMVNTIRTTETLRRAVWVLLIAGAFLGGLSIYQQLTGTFNNNFWGFAQVSGVGFETGVENLQGAVRQVRLDGPIGEKNYYAQIMLVLVPFGLFQFQSERSRLLRSLAGMATMAILIGIALTFSRGIAVGFVLMLMVMIVRRYIKLQQLVFVLVGVFLLFQLFPQYGLRLSSLQSVLAITEEDSAGISGTDQATQGRIGEMWAAWLVFIDHPFIGVGPGMFNFYYPEYAERVGLRIHTGNRAAHNLFLGIAADHGLLGLLFFLFIIIATLRNLEKVRQQMIQAHPNVSNMATAFFLAIVGYLASGLFLTFAYERYFWLILGLADAMLVIVARQVSPVSEAPPKTKGELLSYSG